MGVVAGVGRGLGVSAGLGVGEGLGVEVGVAVGVAVAVAVGVAVGVGVGPDCAQYLPPLFTTADVISSAPNDHFTASPDCRVNVSGSWAHLVVLVAIQLSVPGLYLPPVLK